VRRCREAATAYDRGVDCSGLNPQQVERMLAVLYRQRDYLTRLVERMRIKRFPTDDPVYRAALAAYEKVSNLCVVVATCRTPPEDNVMSRKPWAG
jgi:hypothetical protein